MFRLLGLRPPDLLLGLFPWTPQSPDLAVCRATLQAVPAPLQILLYIFLLLTEIRFTDILTSVVLLVRMTFVSFTFSLLLWQEFSNQTPPLEFGRDVTVTSSAGLQAQFIYHVAVRQYRDDHSVKVCANSY